MTDFKKWWRKTGKSKFVKIIGDEMCPRIFVHGYKISREAWEKGSLKKEESMRSCEGCKHKPKEGEPYYAPCGECRWFYSDHFEKRR